MSRYSVELDELLAFVGSARPVQRAVGSDRHSRRSEITQLHGTWSGLGADAEKQYHATWRKLAEEMRGGADYLRKTASAAHRNYTDVTALNSSMWP